MSSNNHFRFKTVLAFVLVAAISASSLTAAPPNFLKKLFQRKPSTDVKSFELTQEDGPWLILAATFVGDDSKSRAERLATQIRKDLRLKSYVYNEKFDFTQNPGVRSAPNMRARYVNQYQYEAHAVLVGEYDSIQHPSVEKDLKKLKSASMNVFQAADIGKETDALTPVTTVKAIHKRLIQRVSGANGNKKKGPMSNAFITRNPMLPADFFSTPAVDSFVQQLNEDKQHSLLLCDGKYTVVVRTFEGLGTLVDGKQENKFVPSLRRMDKFASQANKMVLELRKQGEEAYQFHDRYRSLVTIGSFDSLGHELPGGGFQYEPEIQRTMEKYSAFNAQRARSMPGTSAVAANHIAMIPFDVQPKPIAVPKKSKRSLYSAALRR